MKKEFLSFVIILIALSEMQADVVTFRSGKVVENVKTTVQKDSIVIQYEEGKKESKPKGEIKSLKIRPVVWRLAEEKKRKQSAEIEAKLAEEKRKAEEEEKARVAEASEKGTDFELRPEEDKISPMGNFAMGLIPIYSGQYRTKNTGAGITFTVLESIALLNLVDIASAKRTRATKAEYLPFYWSEQSKVNPGSATLGAINDQTAPIMYWFLQNHTKRVGTEKGGVTGRVIAGEQASNGRQDSFHKLNLGLSAGALLTVLLFDGIFSYLAANDWNEGTYSGEKSPGFVKPTTGWSRGIRSALFPGYGQIYGGEKFKGGIYVAIGAALFVGAIAAEMDYKQAQKFYVKEAFPLFWSSGMMDSYIGGNSTLSILIGSSMIKARRDKVESTEEKANLLINSFLCFWAFNIVDAVFFSGVDKPKVSFRPDLRLGTAQNNGVLVYEPKIGATLTYSF